MNAIMQMFLPAMRLDSGLKLSSSPGETNEVFAKLIEEELGKLLGKDWQKNADLTSLLNSPLFAQLLDQLNALLDRVGTSEVQKQELMSEITSQITKSFMSGDTEGLVSFISQLLNSQTPEEIQQAVHELTSRENDGIKYVDTKGNVAEVSKINQTNQAHIAGEAAIDSGTDQLVTTDSEPKEVVATANEQLAANASNIPDKVNNEQVLKQLVGMFQEKEGSLLELAKLSGTKIDPVVKLDSSHMEFISLMKDVEFQIDGTTTVESNPNSNAAELQTRIDMVNSIKDLIDRVEIKAGPKVVQTVFELKPPTLGQTQLRLEFTEEKVMLDFLVAKAEAKDMIQNSLNDLRNMFQDKGLNVVSVNVDVDHNLAFGQGLFSSNTQGESSQSYASAPHNGAQSILFDEDTVRSYETLYLDDKRVNCLA